MPEIFYKYRSDSTFTEKIISSGQVFLATAHQLNDPFECSLQEISKEWLDRHISQTMRASLDGFSHSAKMSIRNELDFFGLEKTEVRNALDQVFSRDDLSEQYNMWRSFMYENTGHFPSDCREFFHKIDEQLTETGIFSLSKDPEQTLMWAHYADNHCGLNLGFSAVEGSRLASDEHCLHVIYSDDLPEISKNGLQTQLTMAMGSQGRLYSTSMKLAFTDQTFQKVVSTKSTHWRYEKEVRYVEPFSGLCKFPGPLVECTFGMRCTEERREQYIALLEEYVENEVLLFEMIKVPGTNKMSRIQLECKSTEPKFVSSAGKRKQTSELSVEEFAMQMAQLIQKEQYGLVTTEIDQFMIENGSSPRLLHLQATACGLAKDHPKALEIYKGLTVSYPEVAAGWYGMSCALVAMGELDGVVALLRRAYKLDPNDSSIVLNLGVHLSTNVKTQTEGIQLLRKAHKMGHRRAARLVKEHE